MGAQLGKMAEVASFGHPVSQVESLRGCIKIDYKFLRSPVKLTLLGSETFSANTSGLNVG